MDDEDKELDDLKRQVNELKNQIDPPPRQPSTHPRFDPTANFSLPPSVVREMVAAVPESVMQGIRADAFKSTGSANPQPTNQVQRGSGWAKPIPVEPPPGIELCDRLVDAQDAQDRTELARKIAQARLAEGK